MTVQEIQKAIAMYLQRDVDKFDIAGTGQNLILVAMNNARKYAERRHNWTVCRKKGYLTVPAGGKVAWDSPTWFDGGTEKMKEGKFWWLRGMVDTTNETTDQDAPLKVISKGVKQTLENRRQYEGWEDEWGVERDLWKEGVNHPLLGQTYGMTAGKWLELYPANRGSSQLVVDGYVWWPDWSDGWTSYSINLTIPYSWILDMATYHDGDYIEVQLYNSDGLRRHAIRLKSVNGFPYTTGATHYPQVAVDDSLGEWYPLLVTNWLNMAGFSAAMVGTTGLEDVRVTAYPPAGVWTMTAEQYYDGVSTVLTANETTSDTDWWTENASEYLILRSIVEANRLGQIFTGNKEGNLPAPEKQAEKALEDLIAQDIASENAGAQIEFFA